MSTSLPSTQTGVLRNETSSKIQSFPVLSPGPGEVLVQNVAVASNPKDFKHPAWEKNHSYVEGNDVADYIVKVGEGVSDFKGREHVAAFTKMGTQDSKYGAYAQFSVAPASTTIPIPDSISFEEAATLPLAVFTAAVGLFVDLGIMQPPVSGEAYKSSDRVESVVIVYGASSSVGAYVIQLVKCSGYFAVGVAGSSGDYAKSPGADVIVDYRNKSLEELVNQNSLLFSIITQPSGIYHCNHTTLALARALAKVSPGGKSKVTHLLPLDDETKKQIPAGVETIETYIGICARFARQLTSYLVSSPSHFKPNRVKLMPNGLASVGEGIDLLKNGKVHGEKLVCRVAETPGLQS